jgi:acyl-CoA thioester hydrolase
LGTPVVAARRVRLTYADTDAAGILYYAAWFPWMERVNVEWAYEQGFRIDRMMGEHGASPVTRSTTCEYVATATVYDEIDVEMRVDHVGNRSYRYGFTMTRVGDRVVVARSSLTMVCVGPDGRPTAIPAALRSVLHKAAVRSAAGDSDA